MGGALHGGVNLAGRDFTGTLKALPCVEKSVSQTRIEKPRFSGGRREIAEDLFNMDEVRSFKSTAGVSGQRLLQKRT